MNDKLSIGSVVFAPPPSMPSRVDVKIQNNLAPTADHLKLLQDMRSEIEKAIIATFEVKDTPFHVAGYVAKAVGISGEEIKIHARYKINGADYYIDDRISVDEFRLRGWDAITEKLVRSLSASVFDLTAKAVGPEITKQLRDVERRLP